MMQYFIGVVPPDDYKIKLTSFQRQWRNNALVEVVEPHITVKAQGGLTEDKKWLDMVKSVCQDVSPIMVTLNQPMFLENMCFF